MATIWKFPLQFGVTLIEMPAGAKILSVQAQNGVPCAWALVDPAKRKERRSIAIYGTGHDTPEEPGQFLGTFQLEGGALIFHAFQEY